MSAASCVECRSPLKTALEAKKNNTYIQEALFSTAFSLARGLVKFALKQLTTSSSSNVT
jgi:hypothetical protein